MTANFNPSLIEQQIKDINYSMDEIAKRCVELGRRLTALEKYLPVIEKLAAGTIAPESSLDAVLAHEHKFGADKMCECGVWEQDLERLKSAANPIGINHA